MVLTTSRRHRTSTCLSPSSTAPHIRDQGCAHLAREAATVPSYSRSPQFEAGFQVYGQEVGDLTHGIGRLEAGHEHVRVRQVHLAVGA
jgi:hypothetical protein